MKDHQKRLRAKVYSMRFSEEMNHQILLILDEEDLEQIANGLIELLVKEYNSESQRD